MLKGDTSAPPCQAHMGTAPEVWGPEHFPVSADTTVGGTRAEQSGRHVPPRGDSFGSQRTGPQPGRGDMALAALQGGLVEQPHAGLWVWSLPSSAAHVHPPLLCAASVGETRI